MSINIDNAYRAAITNDGRVDASEAQGIVAAADRPVRNRAGRMVRLSRAQKRREFEALLRNDTFDPAARDVLRRAAGLAPAPSPGPAPTPSPTPAPGPTPTPSPAPTPGTRPETISLKADHQVWTTTYWPMAGALPGDPNSNLWATGGPLDKFDQYLEKIGQRKGALEFERKPNLNRMFGRGESGHFIPSATLSENDAERTTGVDINGNGQIDPDVKYDFLSASDRFGRDGKTDSTMSVGWWGSCDKVALAGCLFKEPKKRVTMEGVTFTPQDIKGLLSIIADTQGGGTDFVGNRYDARRDQIVTTDGERIEGIITNVDLVEFRTGNFYRTDDYGRRGQGDNIVHVGADHDLKVRLSDGTERTIPANKVKTMQRESQKDIEPRLFHETAIQWLKDKRPFAMDHDSGDHVWNDNYDGGRFRPIDTPTGVEVSTLNGYNGPYSGGQVQFWNTELLKGDSVSKSYTYWLESKNGRVVNSGWHEAGWGGSNPDFMWRPERPADFTGYNARNPFVKPELVKAIYEQSVA